MAMPLSLMMQALPSFPLKNVQLLGLPATSLAALSAWVVFLIVALALNPKESWPYALGTGVIAAGHLAAHFRLTAKTHALLRCLPAGTHWVLIALVGFAAVAITVYEIAGSSGEEQMKNRMQSVLGVISMVLGSVACSRKMRNIPWRLVACGLLAQFFLGFFVRRTQIGFSVFKATGDCVMNFLDITDVGAEFVFGPDFREHFIAFAVLPKVIFFSSVCSCMYYLGVLQVFVRVVAWALQLALGCGAAESVSAAGNIFLGSAEVPLLIRQILPKASVSEIHSVMTGGFATVAGTVLAAFIGLGVSAEQLIGASVMSAPAALVISKVVCPDGVELWREDESQDVLEKRAQDLEAARDTEPSTAANSEASPAPQLPELESSLFVNAESQEDAASEFELPAPEDGNIVEAAATGANLAIALVANIAAVLIAFLALVAALDLALGKLGSLVMVPELSFKFICGYLFVPVAWLLGAPVQDCRKVAELIGTKVFVNEFVAYIDLAALLSEGAISPRGQLIATYALCGFSNFGSIGIQIGALSAICPDKKKIFASLALSAMIAGNVACFLTAAVAGILD